MLYLRTWMHTEQAKQTEHLADLQAKLATLHVLAILAVFAGVVLGVITLTSGA